MANETENPTLYIMNVAQDLKIGGAYDSLDARELREEKEKVKAAYGRLNEKDRMDIVNEYISALGELKNLEKAAARHSCYDSLDKLTSPEAIAQYNIDSDLLYLCTVLDAARRNALVYQKGLVEKVTEIYSALPEAVQEKKENLEDFTKLVGILADLKDAAAQENDPGRSSLLLDKIIVEGLSRK